MERWQWTSIILCFFGFFKEFRPSEPFITEFLIDYKNITKEEVVQIVYPISTYTYLGVLPVVFLLTDFLRYRVMLFLEGLGFAIVYAMLIWGEGLTNLMILEVFYGVAMACEVAYYTYIYATVDKDQYRLVTSYTYSAIFIGELGAAIVSQLFVSLKWLDYFELNYLSLAGTSLAFVLSLLLPPVRQSIYFHPKEDLIGSNLKESKLNFYQRLKRAYNWLFRDFKMAYSNTYILKWSLWWTASNAVHLQISFYIQTLWEVISPDVAENERWNGGVIASQALLSAVFAIGVARLNVKWEKWGEACLSVISILGGIAVLWMAITTNIYICYVLYVVFRILYQVLITVASAEIATRISDESYGLIFGINTFAAVLVQTLLTIAVTGEGGLALSERDQFKVYGFYNIILGFMFVAGALKNFLCTKWRAPNEDSLQTSDPQLSEDGNTNACLDD